MKKVVMMVLICAISGNAFAMAPNNKWVARKIDELKHEHAEKPKRHTFPIESTFERMKTLSQEAKNPTLTILQKQEILREMKQHNEEIRGELESKPKFDSVMLELKMIAIMDFQMKANSCLPKE